MPLLKLIRHRVLVRPLLKIKVWYHLRNTRKKNNLIRTFRPIIQRQISRWPNPAKFHQVKIIKTHNPLHMKAWALLKALNLKLKTRKKINLLLLTWVIKTIKAWHRPWTEFLQQLHNQHRRGQARPLIFSGCLSTWCNWKGGTQLNRLNRKMAKALRTLQSKIHN